MIETRVPLKPATRAFSYFGGKHRAAGKYPEPERDTIIEPFAGSAGYSHRYWWKQVHLYDADPVIVAVWEHLIAATARDIVRLPILGPDDRIDDFKSLSDAERWLIGFWADAGCSTPANRLQRWARDSDGSMSGFWGEQCRDRLASNVHRFDHWTVTHASYADIPDTDATWFVDPPYQVQGKHYRHGSKDIDFSHLGEWCKSRTGQVIVCENLGADWLPFSAMRETRGGAMYRHGDGSSTKNVEAVWIKPASGAA